MKFLTETGTDLLRQMSSHIQTVMETEACLLTDRSFFINRQIKLCFDSGAVLQYFVSFPLYIYIYKIVWVIDFTLYFLALFKLILSELIDQTGS